MTHESVQICKKLCAYLSNNSETIPPLFDHFEKFPADTALVGLQEFAGLAHPPESVSAFLSGVCIGLAAEDPEFQSTLNNFFKLVKRTQGGNVAEFSLVKGVH